MELKPGYKQTDLGIIPDDWEIFSIGEIAPLQRGVDLPSGQIVPGPFPVVYSNGIMSYHNVALVRAPGVVTGRSGTLGNIHYIDSDFWPHNTSLWVTDFKENNPSFIYYLYQHLGFERFSSGSGVPTLNRNDAHAFRLAIPKLRTEQEAIAEALSDVDDLIESLEQLIAKKRQIQQGAMQDLLTGRKRLSGFDGEWQVKMLGELFFISGGLSASRDQLGSDGYCYLHYGDIHMSKKAVVNVPLEFADLPKLDIPLGKVSTSSLLKDGDVVFVDASEDAEGSSKHVVVINPENIPFISGLHTIVAKSKSNELDPLYRRYCFHTPEVREQFQFYVVGTKVSGISKSNIVKIRLQVPTQSEQIAIASVLAEMDAEIYSLETKLVKARQVKQGMMQELLTGRIRLVQPESNVVHFRAREKPATTSSKGHNSAMNEAVVISVLAKNFGSDQWPLGRKRYTKLSYLLHRHVEGHVEGYLEKAAGPYNPSTKYKGAEKIALTNGYVRTHARDNFSGFVAAEKIAEAEAYFLKWYGDNVIEWLEQFRYKKNDELELLATVDMAMVSLRVAGRQGDLTSVKQYIHDAPEWTAKLNRSTFSDENIDIAIEWSRQLFESEGENGS